MSTLADTCGATIAVLEFSEDVEEQELDDVEHDIEIVWDVSDLRRSGERCPSAIERIEPLCESLSLPSPPQSSKRSDGLKTLSELLLIILN